VLQIKYLSISIVLKKQITQQQKWHCRVGLKVKGLFTLLFLSLQERTTFVTDGVLRIFAPEIPCL